MNIEGAVAVVTGANRGIGRRLVEELLARGAHRVYAVTRRPEALPHDDRVVPVHADITSEPDVATAAAAIDRVDLVINNAGVATFGDVVGAPVDALRRDMETNYFGTLNVVRAFLPKLDRERPGAVVNVLTIAALAGMSGLAGYSASKAAAHSATQALRAQLRDTPITVHGVFPGPVDTDMARDLPMDKAPAVDVARAILRGIEEGVEDIYPDAVAREVGQVWARDPKGLERRFAGGIA